MKRKPYDLLDFSRTQYERDMLEFEVNIHDLEMGLQVGWRRQRACLPACSPGALLGAAWGFAGRRLGLCWRGRCAGRRLQPVAAPATQLPSPQPSAALACPRLQGFINNSFANISSTEHALSLLQQFRAIMQRPSLQRELATKWLVIFQHYARDLEQVRRAGACL